jgi:hypothetical protein
LAQVLWEEAKSSLLPSSGCRVSFRIKQGELRQGREAAELRSPGHSVVSVLVL